MDVNIYRLSGVMRELKETNAQLRRIASALEIVLEEEYRYHSRPHTDPTGGPPTDVIYTDDFNTAVNEALSSMGKFPPAVVEDDNG